MNIRLLLLVSLVPASAIAAEVPPSPAASLVQMLLGLVLTLALLFGSLMLLKRLQGARANHASALRVISATSVGPRERVVLVAVGKQVLVVGVAPGRVTALHTMAREDLPPIPDPAPAPPPLSGEFARQLKKILGRRREK